MTGKGVFISKKVWQTPTVEIISIAGGNVIGGGEGSTSNHNFTPARAASRYHS